MRKCVHALQPYEDITKKLSDSTSTAAEVIPIVKSLKHTLQHTTSDSVVSNPVQETLTSDTSSEDEPGLGSVVELNEDRQATQAVNFMKEAMRADVEKRFSSIENEDLYRIATYIDPRYKSKFFSSSHVTHQVKLSLARVCEELCQTTILEEEDGEPRRKRRRDDMSETPATCGTIDEAMTSILASSSDDEAENSSVRTLLMKDIEKYHTDKRISGTSQDSLQWWKTMKTVYPDLAKVACQYLSCPPSSVPSEQLFSSAGLIYDAKRNRLLPEKVDKLLFLKRNLPILNFKY
ncbi:Zinc finger BED domain-containing protein 4 [Portunus trituberculatus]|uniref:Zinc finger BED domain-containing protein 4 n=1 Tax=Portunus trituberculatus TaxID=210409 RepID=A0A5B7KCQ8_PORTR|nr:Zinc finger BED domain-containing protein 4 [Portunus trituberculatus]